MIGQALYSVETNLDFRETATDDILFPDSVLSSYRLTRPISVKRIEKKNLFSEIFLCKYPSTTIVIRSTGNTAENLLEIQCRIFSGLEGNAVLKPLLNSDNRFVTSAEGHLWIAYPYIEGLLYEGRLDQLLIAFHRSVEVARLLKSTGENLSPAERQVFPEVSFEPNSWKQAIERLTGDLNEAIIQALGADLHAFIQSNKTRLEDLVGLLSGRNLPDSYLTHYDLQHANVVMSDPEPTIIDLEDIYIAPLEIALSYSAFKLSRHAIFVDPASKSEVIEKYVPQICEIIKDDGIYDRRDLFEFSSIRTLNDIAYIFHLYFEKNLEFVLYDLRKKVLNLLEGAELTGYPETVGLR